MAMVTSIVVEEYQPPEAGTKPRFWGQKHGPDLLLVIFDTAVIDRINNERYSARDMKEFRLREPPGKYAVYFEEGFTDSGIFGQVMLTHDKYRDAAVWFDRFDDLPFAIRTLQERYPEVNIPDQVRGVIDWPVKRDNITPGATVVVTGPPLSLDSAA